MSEQFKEVNMPIQIRHMDRHDLRAVGQIEETCFSDPWLPEVIGWSVARQQASGLVAICEGEVVGYAIYQLESDDRGSLIRLSRLAVHPAMRRIGIGEMLLEAVEARMTLVRRRLLIPVRESNLAGQLFLKTEIIECRAIQESYFGDGETAYMFELEYEQEDFYSKKESMS